MMYKYQFRKIEPYDWFCGPGSHLSLLTLNWQSEHNRYSKHHHITSRYLVNTHVLKKGA